jgi:benzoyl-CoA reductase/2-hydroxyglutaryl-CoA dehydratase subunit BcrC/BadD/HgdB
MFIMAGDGDARKSGFIRMKELKDEGRQVVGTYCSYTPVELIEAAGAVQATLCAVSQDGVLEGEKTLPQNLCPMVKASYGMAASDKCPYFHFSDMVVAETTCDGKKKMLEFLSELRPTHVMQLPQGLSSDEAVNFWTNEMHRAKDAIERTLGVEITEEALHEAIRRNNEERRDMLEIYSVGQLEPCPVSIREFCEAMDGAGFAFDKGATVHRMAERAREIKEEALRNGAILTGKGVARGKSRKPRILITGCPNVGVREKILYALEDAGASIVAFDSCNGVKTMREMVAEEGDPYRAMAEKTLKANCSVMSPNPGRYVSLKEACEEFGIDGVVEIVLQFCHTYAIEAVRIGKFVREELGLPYLELTSDYSDSDQAQMATRINAFVEMML